MNDYSKPFYIRGPQGNNALSYEAREKNLGREPVLHVASLIEGDLEDVQEGEEVAFEDFDEWGRLVSARGLRNFVRMGRWVVFDNHNHALWFWYEALSRGLIRPGAALVHVDQHKDTRRPERMLESADLEVVFRYTNFEVNVGNYIVPAVGQGLIGEVLSVTSEAGLADGRFFEEKNKILNIDLDFFAPEMGIVDFEAVKVFVRRHAENAAIVTVATSPFFIEQGRARNWLEALLT